MMDGRIKRYMTTIQTHATMPGDLIPPGGYGWILHSLVPDPGGMLYLVWSRDEKSCPSCHVNCLVGCRIHQASPHCERCRGRGFVAA